MGRVASRGVWCTDTSKQTKVESWLYFADTCEQTLRSEAATRSFARVLRGNSSLHQMGRMTEIQSHKGLDNDHK